jgi:hypothetical protein
MAPEKVMNYEEEIMKNCTTKTMIILLVFILLAGCTANTPKEYVPCSDQETIEFLEEHQGKSTDERLQIASELTGSGVKFKESHNLLKQILADKPNDRAVITAIYLGMGINYLSAKGYEKAKHYSDKSLTLSENTMNILMRTEAYLASGIICYYINVRDEWKYAEEGIKRLETSLANNPAFKGNKGAVNYADLLTSAINLGDSYSESPECFDAEKSVYYTMKLRELLLERDKGNYSNAFYQAAMTYIIAEDYEKAAPYVDSYKRETDEEYSSKILQLYYFTAIREFGYSEKLAQEILQEAGRRSERDRIMPKPALGLYSEAIGDIEAAKKYFMDFINSEEGRLNVNSKLLVDIEKRLGLDFSDARQKLKQEIIDGRDITLEMSGIEDEAATALGFS